MKTKQKVVRATVRPAIGLAQDPADHPLVERQPDSPVVAHPATTLVQALASAAANPSTDMDKMERLWAMHRQMLETEAKAAFNAALARAQIKIQPIVRDAENKHTNSLYASLAAINDAVMPIISAEGLSITFDTETVNAEDPITKDEIRVVAYLGHSGGHTRRYHIDLPLDIAGSGGKVNKTGVQAKGSTNEYARRYLVRMMLNISTFTDTDGNDKGKRTGMPAEEYESFSLKITSTSTRAAAEAVAVEAFARCDALNDLETYKALRDDLKSHLQAIADGTIT